MPKLDKHNRLLIPKALIKASSTDFSKEVRLYNNGLEFYLDNPSSENYSKPNLGPINIDDKGRFYFPEWMQESLLIFNNITIFSLYLLKDKITFRITYSMP